MATAKKTSTKKTTRKRTVSARAATKKSVAKKPAVKNAKSKQAGVATKKTDVKGVTLQKIFKFNLFAALVNAVFAVLSVIFLSKQSVEFTLAHSTKDELASTEATVLGPAFRAITEVEVRYLLAFIFGLSAVFSLLLATRLRKQYEAGVTAKVSTLRWIFIGLISAFTLELATILAGVHEIVTLKLVGALVLVTALLGWLAEKQNQTATKNFAPFWLSVLTGFLAWIPLLVGLIATGLVGMERFSWYVYVLAGVLLLGFSNFALNKYNYIKNGANNAGYLQYEGKYLSNHFLIGVATFVILFVAFYK